MTINTYTKKIKNFNRLLLKCKYCLCYLIWYEKSCVQFQVLIVITENFKFYKIQSKSFMVFYINKNSSHNLISTLNLNVNYASN